eukprot:6392495-Prymnesium_polylepis.1
MSWERRFRSSAAVLPARAFSMARASARRALSRALAVPASFRESEAATVARMAVTVGRSLSICKGSFQLVGGLGVSVYAIVVSTAAWSPQAC